MAEMRPRAAPAFLAAAVLLIGAAACSDANGLDKSGGSPPVRLTFANSDADLGALPAVRYFLDRVKRLSSGQLQIDVRSSWGGGAPGYEPGVLRDVRSGKADLAWLGTRVFDTAGVRSFQALNAPLLVDSYALEKAVLRSRLPAEMLAGLRPIRLVGLAVFGDKLRKPFGTKHFLLEPTDYAGLTFRTYDSDVQEQAVRALGAYPSDIGWAGLYDALKSGTLQGTETDLRSYTGGGDAAVAPYATVNVNLWPRTTALVANAAAFAKLSPQQQGWLKQAAAEAAVASLRLLGGDGQSLAQSCASGAHAAEASARDLVALRKAWMPLYAGIDKDPQTRTFVQTIRSLKRSVRAERLRLPAACQNTGASNTSTRTGDPRALNGVYRVEWPEQELLAAGAPPAYATDNHGLITMTLRDGRLRLHWTYGRDCLGSYSVSRDTLRITQAVNCHGLVTATWSLRGSTLRLHVTRWTDPGDHVEFGRKPWTKIG